MSLVKEISKRDMSMQNLQQRKRAIDDHPAKIVRQISEGLECDIRTVRWNTKLCDGEDTVGRNKGHHG